MTEEQAREFFLEKIRSRLAEEGQPLAGKNLAYLQALKLKDEEELDTLLADKNRRKEFAAMEDRFESALHRSIVNDLIVDSGAREKYLSALKSLASSDGIRLQAVVFPAANRVKELNESKPWQSALIMAITLALIAIGAWIGIHLRR